MYYNCQTQTCPVPLWLNGDVFLFSSVHLLPWKLQVERWWQISHYTGESSAFARTGQGMHSVGQYSCEMDGNGYVYVW